MSNLPKAIILDLDSTLALFEGKDPYKRAFIEDEVSIPVHAVVEAMKAQGYTIIIVSGRRNIHQEETEAWLKKHKITYDLMYMSREPKDGRKDYIVKREIYEKYLKGKYEILFAIDDRKVIKKLWVSLGIFVLDVNQHDLVY